MITRFYNSPLRGRGFTPSEPGPIHHRILRAPTIFNDRYPMPRKDIRVVEYAEGMIPHVQEWAMFLSITDTRV